MLYDVFLGAAAADRTTAEALRLTLQRRRCTCWLADDLSSVEQLAETLAQSRVVLLLASPASVASDLVKVLARLVVENNRPCIVGVLDRAELLPFSEPSRARYYEFTRVLPLTTHLDRLAEMIASLPELDRAAADGVTRRLLEMLESYHIDPVGDGAESPGGPQRYDFMRGVETGTPPRADRGECTVFAPASAHRGEDFLVQLLIHRPKASARTVAALARLGDRAAQQRGRRSLRAALRIGDDLSFDLNMAPFIVDGSPQSIVWDGRAHSVQFKVRVLPACRRVHVVGVLTVSVGTVPVGDIKFTVDVVKRGHGASPKLEPLGDQACRYRRAFVSYAWADRDKVIDRVQMLDLLGIEYFQDVLHLRPGDRWEKELYRKIDEADLFLLFWSKAARQSRWVRRETRYAIRRQSGNSFSLPEIKPVIIDGPPPQKPWPELRHLHFNDKFIYFRRAPAA